MTTSNVTLTTHLLAKRGNTAVSTTYTGLVGELTVDTDLKTVRVHDGSTAGGHILANTSQTDAANLAISTLNANVGAYQSYANTSISTLTANAAVQAAVLDTLTGNAVTQHTELVSLTANAATQADELAVLLANAASQADDLAGIVAFQTYANSTFSTSSTVDALDANVGTIVGTTIPNLDANLGTATTNISTLDANLGTATTNISTLDANLGTATTNITTLQSQVYANANVKTYLSEFDGNIIPSANATYYLGDSTHQWKELWVTGNTIYLGNIPLSMSTSSDATLYVNNQPIVANVTNLIDANIGATTENVTNIDANIGSYQTWANTNISTLDANLGTATTNITTLQSDVTTIDANIGSYQTWANASINTLDANVGTITTDISTLLANAAAQADILNTLSGNAVSQETELASLVANAASQATDLTTLLANAATQEASLTTLTANAAAQSGAIDNVNANIGSYQTYANTTFATSSSLNTLDANVGTVVGTTIPALDANLGTATTNITTLDANLGTATTNISTLDANIGAFQTYSNAQSYISNVVEDTTPQLGGNLDMNSKSIIGSLKIEDGSQERFSSLSSATGNVTHDCANGSVFYHTSISSDFTANFTNLELDSSYATAITLVLVQGATAYIANSVQISGAAQTINWQGNAEPTGTANRVDALSFTIINNSGTYTVLGQLTDF